MRVKVNIQIKASLYCYNVREENVKVKKHKTKPGEEYEEYINTVIASFFS